MSIPITPEDFITIGARYLTEDIIAEIDRLFPLATADLQLLATRGYGATQLQALDTLRTALTSESASKTQQRGSKKGARLNEATAVRDGKLVLRSGVAMATAALASRTSPKGETPEQARQIATDTMEQIDALGGRIGVDSAKLRARLTSLQTVMGLPALAPSSPDETKARADFKAKVQAAIAALPKLAEDKKQKQQDAKQQTASLDEIDGRAYTNLKMLTQVGRAYWNEHGNRKRAAEYQLSALHEKAAKAPKDPSGNGSGTGA